MSTDTQTITETRVVTTTETVEKVVCANCDQATDPDNVVRWSPEAGVEDGCVVADAHPRLCEACSDAVFGVVPSEPSTVGRARATVREASAYSAGAALRLFLRVGPVAIGVTVAGLVVNQMLTMTPENLETATSPAPPLFGPDLVVSALPIVAMGILAAIAMKIGPRRF